MSDRLLATDRRTVDGFRKLGGWIGYAEEHGIVLDFGDRLARYGPGDSLWLGLAGWVEYPYSQTNYAAATAGVLLRPPTVERRREDGSWELIEPHAGYPAGLPRLTMLDLSGKLCGPRCAIRLRTNLECYWDRAFIAVRDRGAEVRVSPLPVSRARLGYRGFTREASPDGLLPLLYDYNHVDPAPLARMSGLLTRYGDVARLLRDDDDRLCLLGPGDEVRLEFDATGPPSCPKGGPAASSSAPWATARTPTRSPPPATRSGRSPGAECSPSRSAPRGNGRATQLMRTTSARSRPAPRAGPDGPQAREATLRPPGPGTGVGTSHDQKSSRGESTELRVARHR